MVFGSDWLGSGSKAVMDWYKLQTWTKFKSIQHWRSLDTRFYHEFLIIQLTDGSACRVERIGEGSRADAISRVGCTAHDFIQWFPAQDHAAKRWSRGAQELIVQVDFPRTFDILDIIAICYSIQKSQRASVYTLQRYNCYFLCCTILVVLTRRIAEWESLITDADWATITDKMTKELERKALLPVEQQHATDFLALGICSLLDPNNPNPAGFLYKEIRSRLSIARQSLASVLWYKDSGMATIKSLSTYLGRAVQATNNSGHLAASRLHTLLGKVDEQRYPPTELDLPWIQKTVSGEVLAMWSSEVTDIVTRVNESRRARELEGGRKIPLVWRLRISTCGAMSRISIPLAERIIPEAFKFAQDQVGSFCERFGVTLTQALSTLPPTKRSSCIRSLTSISLHAIRGVSSIGKDVDSETEIKDLDGAYDIYDIFLDLYPFVPALLDHGADRLFLTFLLVLQMDSERPNLPAALAFLNAYFPTVLWEHCFMNCLYELYKGDFHSLLSLKTSTLGIRLTDNAQEPTTTQTVIEFQEHIRQRIHKHAQRVESFQLGAASLVQTDIERAMDSVWRLLPSGFGATKA